MSGFSENMGAIDWLQEVGKGVALIVLLFGALECFFGYKLFKFWIALCGFALFAGIGTAIGFGVGSDDPEPGIIILLAVVFGVLGAFLAYKLYLIGVFFLCFFMGGLFGLILSGQWAPGIVIGFVAGILGVLLVKPVVILITSLSGGTQAGLSLGVLLELSNTAAVLVTVVLIGLGVWMQFRWESDKEQKLPNQAAPSARTPNFMEDAQERAGQVWASSKSWLERKAEQDRARHLASYEADQVHGLSDRIRHALYEHPVGKFILPFDGAALVAVTVLVLLKLLPPIALIVSVVPSFSKRSHSVLSVCLAVTTIALFIRFWDNMQYVSYYEAFDKIRFLFGSSGLIELSVIGWITYEAIARLVKQEQVRTIWDRLQSLKNVRLAGVPHAAAKETSVNACTGCGTELTAGARFCGNCGNKL